MTGVVVPTYDVLAGLVALWRGMVNPVSTGGEAPSLLYAEARLLDDRRFEEWLELWAPGGALWVPLDPAAHPGRDQSFYLDDVRRLRERVAWRSDPSTWSEESPVHTIRQIGNVEAVAGPGGALLARSSLTLHEQRSSTQRAWPAHQLHRFGPPDEHGQRPLEAKVLLVPSLRSAIPHPGALL